MKNQVFRKFYSKLALTGRGNDLIFDDIMSALEAGRSPVVILPSARTISEVLAERLCECAKNVVVLQGGMSVVRARAATEALATIPDRDERVLVATGRYLGEGFDDARLDTLFLTMPISWRGTLAQYAGRLHRLHAAKRDVIIYDYIDEGMSRFLLKMAAMWEAGYRNLGYRPADRAELV